MSSHAGSFAFEYVDLRHFPPAPGGRRVFAIFGRLVDGHIHQGEGIALPAADGSAVVGTVSRFQETFDDGLGLPFYHTVVAEPDPFCVFIVTPFGSPQPAPRGLAGPPGST